MRVKAVGRIQWKEFFDTLSREVENLPVELETANLDIGDQVEEDRCRLEWLEYDPQSDILIIQTDRSNHTIAAPHQVRVWEKPGRIDSIGVKDDDGSVLIIHFLKQLRLPAGKRPRPRSW